MSQSKLPSLEKACIAKGMRMTEQRRIIAQVPQRAADHPDVEELSHRANKRDPKICISTVDRRLELYAVPLPGAPPENDQ